MRLVVFVVWSLCLVSGAYTQQSDLEAAKRAYLEGSFEESIELLKPLLGTLENPTELREANFFLGLDYMALRRESDAQTHFESAVRHDPAFLPSDTLYSPEVIELYERVRDGLVGRLQVESQPPGAEVTVAGRELGQTPVQEDVLAGEQLVHVELEGHTPVERVVSVRANEDTSVNVTLKPVEAPETKPVTEEAEEPSAQQPPPTTKDGGVSGKTIGILAGVGGGAALVAVAAGGGDSGTPSPGPMEPTPAPTPSRANINASIAPNPIIAQPTDDRDFPWRIDFEVIVRETAGLGGNIDFINTTLINAATGAEIPALNFGADEIIGRAGTNHVDGGASLPVPLALIYRLSGGERRAILRAFVRFTDDRRNVLEAVAEANVQ